MNKCCEHTYQQAMAQAYQQARGGDDKRFDRHGRNQMYWKGRSDAAAEIRGLMPDHGKSLEGVVAERTKQLEKALEQAVIDLRAVKNLGVTEKVMRICLEWARRAEAQLAKAKEGK